MKIRSFRTVFCENQNQNKKMKKTLIMLMSVFSIGIANAAVVSTGMFDVGSTTTPTMGDDIPSTHIHLKVHIDDINAAGGTYFDNSSLHFQIRGSVGESLNINDMQYRVFETDGTTIAFGDPDFSSSGFAPGPNPGDPGNPQYGSPYFGFNGSATPLTGDVYDSEVTDFAIYISSLVIGNHLNTNLTSIGDIISGELYTVHNATGFDAGAPTGGTVQLTTFSVEAVPEPSSTALLGLGGLALIFRRRK